ncbi:MAG TPA: hypothetical protein VGQ39_17785 [Pyrinomonadaceae bacterium]|jgi:hypothetical protein|nr:hypothetical protein [Pyrinomonadaceae bacterium]
MNKFLQLGEVLESIEQHSDQSSLYLTLDEGWNERTRCAVLESDPDEIAEPLFATEHGLEYALGIHSVRDVIDNVRQQVTQPSLRILQQGLGVDP